MNMSEKFIYQSNHWYNDGLKKAQIHDLSGATESLKRSLKFNKDNIDARNLLGLVYYGLGEVGEASVEWIISKNLQPQDNLANYYINKIKENPNELEKINQALKKYNQCLVYCRQNGEDLAMIQLKKIVTIHPNFLKARQLLVLLYMHNGEFAKARQLLRVCMKQDITNEITLRYVHELKQMRARKAAKIREDHHEQAVTFHHGNETIIQPSSAGVKENAGALTVINILIGIAVGAAVVWFLIMPAANKRNANSTNKSVIELSEQVAAQNTQIETLKSELSGYRDTSDQAENAIQTADSTKSSYEGLIKVKNQFDGGQTSNADMLEGLLAVNKDALGEGALQVYQEIADKLFPTMSKRLYESAQKSYNEQNYDAALADIQKVLTMDATYDEGGARKLLGDIYAAGGYPDQAKEAYNRVISDFAGTEAAKAALAALDGSEENAQTTEQPSSDQTEENTQAE